MPPPEVLERWRKERITNAGPDELRELIERLRQEMADGLTPSFYLLDPAADAWEACELALLERRRVAFDRMAESRKLRKWLEDAKKHQAEFKWLLTHDGGDLGGIGRKRWLERKNALLAALAGKE
jgi:hypothetical protein